MGKILNCNCTSIFQDTVYGINKRYHNSMFKGRDLLGFRCSVCAHKQEPTSDDKKDSAVVNKDKPKVGK
jgi:hypothetical protein